jgi:hypothetical protein
MDKKTKASTGNKGVKIPTYKQILKLKGAYYG